MGNPRIRGLVFLVIGLIFAWFACVFLPYIALPGAGLSIAIPVITVPGEIVYYNWIGSFDLTNTLLGGLWASALVLLWVGLSYRSTNGWTREIPDRWQAWAEVFVETFYNFCKGIAGDRLRTAPFLWPIVAAIFIFLLAGNWGKLAPGFESVGFIHCAHVGFSGYPRIQGAGDTWRQWVDRPLFAGATQTEESEHACADALKANGTYYGEYDPAAYAEANEAYNARIAAIQGVAGEASRGQVTLMSNAATEETHSEEPVAEVAAVPNEPATGICLTPEQVLAGDAAALEGQLGGGNPEGGEHSEEAAPTEEAPHGSAGLTLSFYQEAEGEHGTAEEAHSAETASPEAVAVAYTELLEAESAYDNQQISALALEQARCAVTLMIHPGAAFPMSAEQLAENRIQPYIFTLAPFFRAVSTDLSFNIGLAIFAVVAIQVYGVIGVGPAYFEKFVNLTALGKGRVIDFVVGLIEIISELGKILSLSFRLFGNIFAGGIVLIMFSFLLAFFVPGIIIGLEVIIGLAQALVFAVLTLVFSVQAMEAHHGDDHDSHDDHGDEH
ncbi:MAG: F0F1 ATP synthase subunit A [Phototrophicaceae bacterium]|jgi:F0F1-type ATP synthase membrane subunit a